jgi:hypothetical protein
MRTILCPVTGSTQDAGGSSGLLPTCESACAYPANGHMTVNNNTKR